MYQRVVYTACVLECRSDELLVRCAGIVLLNETECESQFVHYLLASSQVFLELHLKVFGELYFGHGLAMQSVS